MLITLLVFILILGLLVFVHEFGHFWVAKKMGITVHEFAFGFRPRLFAWKRGETEYAINLIPLGGYVRMEGEGEDTGKKGSFMAKSPGVRIAVAVAGVIMNLILAWILLAFAYGLGSYQLSPTFGAHKGIETQATTAVAEVVADSPAAKAGLQAGDEFVAVAGEPVDSPEELVSLTQAHRGQTVPVVYRRGGEEKTVEVTLRSPEDTNQGALGVVPGQTAFVKVSWLSAPWYALLEVGAQIKASFLGFINFVGQLVAKQEVNEDVTGIVGIGAYTGIVRQLGIGPLLQFTALISTNLAVINILPILPLDGGHVLFALVEKVRRKPVSDMYRQWVAIAGLVAILLLFVIVTYQDVLRFSLVDRIQSLF